MSDKELEIEKKALTFLTAIGNAYKDFEEREDFSKLELREEELTEDFTAMLLSLSYLYEKITGDTTDLIGFTHILNRLAIQYIMEESEEKKNGI